MNDNQVIISIIKENWKVNSKNTMCCSKKNENVKNVEQKWLDHMKINKLKKKKKKKIKQTK